MDRYIDVDKAVEAFNLWFQRIGTRPNLAEITSVLEDQVPAADVEPVRHGKWIQGKGNYVTCSLCGAGTTAESAADDGEPYCFNCGARMDGEV